EGFRIEGSGWKSEQGTAILSRPETARFYEEIARWARERGWLRLGFLRVGGKAIAFQLVLDADGAFYYLKGGYDSEYAKAGPGQLITQRIVRLAFEQGRRSFEFLGSDESWKLDWTKTCRQRLLLHVLSRSPAALPR